MPSQPFKATTNHPALRTVVHTQTGVKPQTRNKTRNPTAEANPLILLPEDEVERLKGRLNEPRLADRQPSRWVTPWSLSICPKVLKVQLHLHTGPSGT